jgi:5-hydroxyisourate hydrolase
MITTHVLDLSTGRPAAGVRISLARLEGSSATTIGSGTTDGDGRLKELVPHATKLPVGTFQLTFETGAYFRARNADCFHPRVIITFSLNDPKQHYHVPLLISPFGYSTYRGS